MYEPTIYPSEYCIHVEGNIGVGKTTFLNVMREKFKDNAEIIEEPIHLWTSFRGTNLLDKMYMDPLKYSYPIQSYIQLTLARNECRPSLKPIKIYERSLMSGRKVFTEAMKKLGYINQDEYNILDDWYEWLCSLRPNCNEIIYLKASPETALTRLRHRGRKEEIKVNIDYLTLVHNLYEDWISSIQQSDGATVTVIDQERPIDNIFDSANLIYSSLSSKLLTN